MIIFKEKFSKSWTYWVTIKHCFYNINMVKYDVDWEITNIYENLQIVRSHFFTDMLLFITIWSTLNVYWFISIRIKRITIRSLSTICNIRSGIWWAIKKVILNYSPLSKLMLYSLSTKPLIFSTGTSTLGIGLLKWITKQWQMTNVIISTSYERPIQQVSLTWLALTVNIRVGLKWVTITYKPDLKKFYSKGFGGQ